MTRSSAIMLIVATDSPLGSRNLERLAKRAMLGLARAALRATNGCGDYVIAFSTAPESRINSSDAVRETKVLGNNAMSPLFLATVKATEEAIYNSLLKATTTTGRSGRTVEALLIDRIVETLKKDGTVK